MKTLITDGKIVLRDSILEDASLLITDGCISYIGKDTPKADAVISAEGGYVIPGFVDLHAHGGGGYDFMDATEEAIRKAAEFHLRAGTTTLVATTLTDREENIEAAVRAIDKHIRNSTRTSVLGIHLEGPYFTPECSGAQDPMLFTPPSTECITDMKRKYPSIIRVSLAPEAEGAEEYARVARSLGVRLSVAHTSADFATVLRAYEWGFTTATHLYSGMLGVTRRNAFRVAGAVEAALYLDGMVCEVIADGCHLPPELLKFIYKIKGADGIALITDATRCAGLPDGRGVLGRSTEVIIEDGVAKMPDRQSFAGSIATMERVYKTMREATDASLPELSRMASLTPARAIGLTDRGEIAVGLRADLLITNKEMNIKKVILKGEIIK